MTGTAGGIGVMKGTGGGQGGNDRHMGTSRDNERRNGVYSNAHENGHPYGSPMHICKCDHIPCDEDLSKLEYSHFGCFEEQIQGPFLIGKFSFCLF